MNKVTTNVKVTELDSLSDTLVRLYKAQETLAQDAMLSSIMAEIEAQSVRLTTAIRRDTVSSTLEEADARRDEAVRLLGTLVEGYTAIPFEAQQKAAESLKATFDKYGKKITGESYANESSLIESLLEDFASLSAEQKALPGVGERVQALRDAQDAFNKASDEYAVAKSDKGESATAVKKELAATLNERLVPYLTVAASLDTHKAFATQTEAEIKKTNEAVSRRGK
ncbi:MAG: hypothetical protein K2H09_04990 [Treponemataceae bacterium]|nr:hypothetical protein [Treponemataceae bacterium]